jgi:hypothetical protein
MINWREDVLSEKTLLSAYKASRSFKQNPLNAIFRWLAAAGAGACALIWILNSNWENRYNGLLGIADIGFDLSVQILGFLVGGFAIFATVTDHRLMVNLASAEMEGENVSVFKYVFFNFISVFFVYLLTLSVSAAVKAGSSINLSTKFFDPKLATVVNSTLFVLVAFLVVASIVRLKSFIWNIYQAFLIFIAVADLMDTVTNSEGPKA